VAVGKRVATVAEVAVRAVVGGSGDAGVAPPQALRVITITSTINDNCQLKCFMSDLLVSNVFL
jgi:hypothetical protein